MSERLLIHELDHAIRKGENSKFGIRNLEFEATKNKIDEKHLGDEWYYAVQAVPDTKAKTLYIVSTFKNKNQYKKEASQLINANSPNATSKNGSVVTSKNSIPQPEKKSNSFDINSSDRQDARHYALDIDSEREILRRMRICHPSREMRILLKHLW